MLNEVACEDLVSFFEVRGGACAQENLDRDPSLT